jgi:hypothetical protein
MCLFSEFVGAEMVSLTVCDRGGGVGMGRKIVEFGDSIVRALWHYVLLADRFLAESRPSKVAKISEPHKFQLNF